MSIVRPTASGGTIQLSDEARQPLCALCRDEDPIGVIVTTNPIGSRRLDTAICGTCIARALAFVFGRQHVAETGGVAGLEFGDESVPE